MSDIDKFISLPLSKTNSFTFKENDNSDAKRPFNPAPKEIK